MYLARLPEQTLERIARNVEGEFRRGPMALMDALAATGLRLSFVADSLDIDLEDLIARREDDDDDDDDDDDVS